MSPIDAMLAGALALLAAGSASPASVGQSIAEQGTGGGAPPCSTCHGAHYEGSPAIKAPALAGLPKAFILSRLAHYAGPDGHNAYMKPVATALTPSEREAVATYLSGLPSPGPRAH
jgi:cytochrome c553